MDSNKDKKITGGQKIVQILKKKGINRVFIFHGGTIAPILDPMSKDKSFHIFCARHEQGAGYAAIAASKLLGNPQVVMVTSGPGVTNILTPLADAYFDNIPLIVLTGQVSTNQLRGNKPVKQGGFQETDTTDIAKPIAKKVYLVTKTEKLEEVFEEAFYISQEGRKGPVLIDLPMDVQRNTIFSSKFTKLKTHKSSKEKKIPIRDLKTFEKWLLKSKRPVIVAGHGVILSNAVDELRKFAKKWKIPVAMSLLGIGVFPTNSRQSLGFMGYAGSQYCNKTIFNSDLVIAIGTRLDLRQTGTESDKFAPKAKIIRIDIDENELIHSRVPLDLTLKGDAKDILLQINKYLSKNIPINSLNSWYSNIKSLKEKYALTYSDNSLKAEQIIEEVSQLSKGKRVIVTTGVGQHQNWVPRHFHFDYPKRTLLTSGGHGTMGYGLPAAIGAQLTYPKTLVICFDGDGSLQLNIQELAVIDEYKLPIKIFLLDNKRFGLVSEFQLQVWGSDPQSGNKYNPDFTEIAKAYKLSAITIKKPQETHLKIKRALSTKGPVLVHCHIDPQEELSPMLLGGQTLDKMWTHKNV